MSSRMIRFRLGLMLVGMGLSQAQTFDAAKEEAEALIARGDFARAHSVFARVRTNELSVADLRWVLFRRDDTGWRMRDAANLPPIEEAAPELVRLGLPETLPSQRDRAWAEVQESIGDFHWQRQDQPNWTQSRYLAALAWWAGQTNLSLARDRYLGLVKKLEWPASWPGARQQSRGLSLSDEVLDKAISIAERPDDIAPLRLMRALRVGRRQDLSSVVRTERDFELALKASAGLAGRDTILYSYASWREHSGRMVPTLEGKWRLEADPVGAVTLYRQLLSEFAPGKSAWRKPAEARLKELTIPAISVSVPGTFVPGSEIVLYVRGRNATSLVVTLRTVDLASDLRLPTSSSNGDWKLLLPTTGPVVQELSVTLEPSSPHAWAQKQVVLSAPLPAGAYLVEVTGAGKVDREVLLVTDVAMVLQGSGGQVTSWVVEASSGKPVAGLPVRAAVWNNQRWTSMSAPTATDNTGLVSLEGLPEGGQWLILAGTGARQTLAQFWSGGTADDDESWRIYAFTDRPAYRPGDLIQWRITARKRVQGTYTTPGGETLGYEIHGPQGTIITNATVTLNSFGSASGELSLPPTSELGTYLVRFVSPKKPNDSLGDAELFRLEEYRLPEFKVTITPPEERTPAGLSLPKRIRAGEPITVNLSAQFYSGGPLTGAKAEVTVRRQPFGWDFPIPLEFPWMKAPESSRPRWPGEGDVVRRETVTLDAAGLATFIYDPGSDAGDAEYSFTVAVTDASRREVQASKSLRATVEGYAVRATAANRLPRPGEPVRIEFRAQDANEQPVAAIGDVKVTREYWWEIWHDSFGREVSGEDLKRRRESAPVWPPVVDPGMKEWTLVSQGYRSDVVSTHRVATGTNGIGELKFTPAREGYFRISWDSPDIWALAGSQQTVTNRIRADCAVWATSGATELGYRSTGLELVVDKESFRVGEKAPVMVVTTNPGRWVWLSVEADGLVGQQVIEMTGTTRLVHLDVTERMTPNCTLHAASVANRQLARETKSVDVPPVKSFLSMEITPNQIELRPGSEGEIVVTTRDWLGNPVSAEVALAVVDESVFYIQETLAPDPRQFFFGERRWRHVNQGSSFDYANYVRFIRDRDGRVRDERELARLEARGRGDRAEAGGGAEKYMFGAVGIAEDSLALSASLHLEERESLLKNVVITSLPAPTLKHVSEPEDAVVVRHDFRATAYWKPGVITDAEGKASVRFRYPDSTTRWQARGIACTSGNQFGLGTNSVATRLPLTVRLQTPRFLVTGDSAVISANLNNNTEVPLTVRPTLTALGVVVAGMIQQGQVKAGPVEAITIPAGGESRIDWQVQAEKAGEAKLTVVGQAGTVSDAMERTLPVVEFGLEQRVARSGKATNDVTVRLPLPERRTGPTDFTVTVTPSLAVSMLDALPYLADYPYGCTEQTLSRFLPAVVVRKTLRALGLDAETVMARSFGGVTTNAAGRVSPHLGAKKDLLKLDDMVSAGLQRLYGFQHDNGAWGWWGEGPDDAWMTAYVLWGLRLAQAAGVVVEDDRLVRAETWLVDQLATFDSSPDQAAWALHALAAGRPQPGQPLIRDLERRAFDRAYTRRSELNAYSQALLALSAQRFGLTENARALTDALAASAVRDENPDVSVLYGTGLSGASTQPTSHWGRTEPSWRWSDNGVESTSFVVRALLATSRNNPTVEEAVAWLLKNRRGASWSNTRATAIALLALTEYLGVSKELNADVSFEVQVNGRSIASHAFKPDDKTGAPLRLSISESVLVPGTNTVAVLRKAGSAPLYFAVEASFFTQEKPIPPAATELFIRRDYFRLVPVPTLLDGVIDQRILLQGGEAVASGDRLEARLVVETKNDLEYVILEDFKPAGVEALDVRSGYSLNALQLKPEAARRIQSAPGAPILEEDRVGRTENLYVEWRDRRAAIFADRLPAGVWEILVPYRAETPGQFVALPAVTEAMYVPEIRGNSVSRELEVRDSNP